MNRAASGSLASTSGRNNANCFSGGVSNRRRARHEPAFPIFLSPHAPCLNGASQHGALPEEAAHLATEGRRVLFKDPIRFSMGDINPSDALSLQTGHDSSSIELSCNGIDVANGAPAAHPSSSGSESSSGSRGRTRLKGGSRHKGASIASVSAGSSRASSGGAKASSNSMRKHQLIQQLLRSPSLGHLHKTVRELSSKDLNPACVKVALLRLSQLMPQDPLGAREGQLGSSSDLDEQPEPLKSLDEHPGPPQSLDEQPGPLKSLDEQLGPTKLLEAQPGTPNQSLEGGQGFLAGFNGLAGRPKPLDRQLGSEALQPKGQPGLSNSAGWGPKPLDRQLGSETLKTLVGQLPHLIFRFDSLGLSSVASSLANLGHYDPKILQDLQAAAWKQVPDMEPNSARSLLWAFQTFNQVYQAPLSSEWVSDMADVFTSGMGIECCSPQDVVMVLTTFFHLPPPLRPPLSSSHAIALHIHTHLGSFSGEELSRVLRALAGIGYQPSEAWMEAVMGRVEADVRSLGSAVAISRVLRASLALRHRPGPEWMKTIVWQAQRRFNTYRLKDLSTLVWALAKMRYRPHDGWLVAFEKVVLRTLAACPPSHEKARSHATVLWSLATLMIIPQKVWLKKVSSELSLLLQFLNTRDLVMELWAMQRLGHVPRAQIRDELMSTIVAHADAFTSEQSLIALMALSRFSRGSRRRLKWKAGLDNIGALCSQIAPALIASQQPLTALNSWGLRGGGTEASVGGQVVGGMSAYSYALGSMGSMGSMASMDDAFDFAASASLAAPAAALGGDAPGQQYGRTAQQPRPGHSSVDGDHSSNRSQGAASTSASMGSTDEHPGVGADSVGSQHSSTGSTGSISSENSKGVEVSWKLPSASQRVSKPERLLPASRASSSAARNPGPVGDSQPRLATKKLAPGEVKSLLVAVSRLREPLNQTFHEDLLKAVAVNMRARTPTQLATSLIALCFLAYASGVHIHAIAMTPTQLATALIALCFLAYASGRHMHMLEDLALLPRMVMMTAPHLASYNFVCLTMLMRGLTTVRYSPSSAWLAQHELSCVRLVEQGGVHPDHIAMLVNAYRVVNYNPNHLKESVFQRMLYEKQILGDAGAAGEYYEQYNGGVSNAPIQGKGLYAPVEQLRDQYYDQYDDRDQYEDQDEYEYRQPMLSQEPLGQAENINRY
eukprot:gene14753-20801_t